MSSLRLDAGFQTVALINAQVLFGFFFLIFFCWLSLQGELFQFRFRRT